MIHKVWCSTIEEILDQIEPCWNFWHQAFVPTMLVRSNPSNPSTHQKIALIVLRNTPILRQTNNNRLPEPHIRDRNLESIVYFNESSLHRSFMSYMICPSWVFIIKFPRIPNIHTTSAVNFRHTIVACNLFSCSSTVQRGSQHLAAQLSRRSDGFLDYDLKCEENHNTMIKTPIYNIYSHVY